MSGMSRRDLIRASAGAAAIAVPISALSSSSGGLAAAVAGRAAPDARGTTSAEGTADVDLAMQGPVMFCVHDVSKGEVSILHGTDEVVVHDRQLVNRIVRAAQIRRAV